VVQAVVVTTRLVVLAAGSLQVRVEAIAAQMVLQVNTVPVLVLRKPMAMLLVLVEMRQQLIRVVAAVVIGAVGVRLSHRSSVASQQVATQVAVADRVSPRLHKYQYWTLEQSLP
jgi:hypothetical protein